MIQISAESPAFDIIVREFGSSGDVEIAQGRDTVIIERAQLNVLVSGLLAIRSQHAVLKPTKNHVAA